MTMTLISTVTVGAGGAASIDFTSIAGTYTDLQIVFSLRNSTTNDYISLTLNGSSANFTAKQLLGNGSAVQVGSRTDNLYIATATPSSATANTFGNGAFYIPNYTGSTNKSISLDSAWENNATLAVAGIVAGLWSNTAAITSASLVSPSGSFVQYSTASLYGILKGSGGATVS
jgi:hypothetical protein